MKKLTSLLALGTILLGVFSPAIQGVAETAELSDATNSEYQNDFQDSLAPLANNTANFTLEFSALPTNPNYESPYPNNSTYQTSGTTNAGPFGGFSVIWKGYYNNGSSLYQLESLSDEGVEQKDESAKFTFPIGTSSDNFHEKVQLTSKTFKSNFSFVDTQGKLIKDSIQEDMPIAYNVHLVPEFRDVLDIPGYRLIDIHSTDGDGNLKGAGGPVEDMWSYYTHSSGFRFKETKDTKGNTVGITAGEGGGSGLNRQVDFEYVYERNTAIAGDVTAKYEDVSGSSISDDVVKSGNIGEDYTTEQKDIPGYTFKEVKGNASGKFTDQAQTVTYVYEQTKDQSTVVVHDSELTVGDTWKPEDNFDSATDYDGNVVPFSEITVDGSVDTSKVGTYKVTYSRILPAFFSAENQGEYSAVATITVKDAQPVKGGDVTAKYIDTDGNKISDDVVKSGNIGEDYTTEQKDIPGYTFKEVKGNASGKFTDQAQTVTYVYEQTKDQSTVVVHDSELTVGDTWKPEDNFDSATDYDGNVVPFSEITVDGSVDTSKVGTYKVTYSRILPAFFSAENQGEYSAVATITVKDAQPVKGGDVTAKYIDTDGNKISDDIVKTGSVGETYTTEQIAIDGYTFKEVQGKLTGQFTNQAQTVTYVYTKNEIPNVTGTVLVKYVDTDGNNISEDVVKSGTVGEGYSTEKKAIEGYTFKEVQGNTTGQFTNQVQTVTYVYAKNKANTVNPEPKPENKPDSKDKNDNRGITSSTQHGLPATGENERMTMMSIILGLVLLTVVMIISIFRFKKVNK
ncbi:MucBP domain-containing protein [Lactococcus petauri]|uniref:MucBP domain-containing protein n=1 Tax=Lactococcus petauri TaxID=1940789 RepID=UPI0021FC2550|nr:MucBP domain-containing protein [Lactococcus petauri]USI65792.1 MucBP domain-containing protein [Lactococcus petauri]WJE12913.1 MucBP domain-containing protein [Lactococcus petauri]